MIKINKALKLGKMLVNVGVAARSAVPKPNKDVQALNEVIEQRLSEKYGKLTKGD